jgi:DNA-directed RNA polymerase subunit RPC12/RpoP
MVRAGNVIEVPSPERSPRREIKLKCLKCGGQLFKKNTAEENYMDIEARFLDLPKETRYQCLSCGRTFKEKEVEKEAIAA